MTTLKIRREPPVARGASGRLVQLPRHGGLDRDRLSDLRRVQKQVGAQAPSGATSTAERGKGLRHPA
jgi:hypothetical protein